MLFPKQFLELNQSLRSKTLRQPACALTWAHGRRLHCAYCLCPVFLQPRNDLLVSSEAECTGPRLSEEEEGMESWELVGNRVILGALVPCLIGFLAEIWHSKLSTLLGLVFQCSAWIFWESSIKNGANEVGGLAKDFNNVWFPLRRIIWTWMYKGCNFKSYTGCRGANCVSESQWIQGKWIIHKRRSVSSLELRKFAVLIMVSS